MADLFEVPVQTVEKLWQQWRETQAIAPKAAAGGQPPRLLPYYDDLRRWLEEKRDRTHQELMALLREHKQLSVSQSMVSRAVAPLGLPRKKVADRHRRRPRRCRRGAPARSDHPGVGGG
jgi:transposase